MAKIARCGYGSKGQGLGKTVDGYTYIVNDNVRSGDKIQVIATASNGKKFATTAVPLKMQIHSENTLKGKLMKEEAESKGKEVLQTYPGKELGTKGAKTVPEQSPIEGIKPQSEYTLRARAGNIEQYMQTHPDTKLTKHAQETYESYSKQFIKGE